MWSQIGEKCKVMQLSPYGQNLVKHSAEECFNSSCVKFSKYRFKVRGTSLVVQWLRIHLPMQGTRVQSLVWEDPTCRGATKPVSHNYWACMSQLLKPVGLEPMLHNKRSHHSKPHSPQLEKAHAQQRRPNAANKLIN